MKGAKKQLDLFQYQKARDKETLQEEMLQEASSPDTPPQRLVELARAGEREVHTQLAKNPNASRELLNMLCGICPKEVLQNPAWGLFLLEDEPLKGLSVSSLRALLQEPNSHILYAATSNHPNVDIKRELAKRPDCPGEFLERILDAARSSYQWDPVGEIAAEHPNLPQREADRLLLDDSINIRMAAMLHPGTLARQERLGREIIYALRQYVPQEELPLPLTKEQRAALLEAPSEMSARLLLWDLETPSQDLLACYRGLSKLPSFTTASLLASHPNCPPELWPELEELNPVVFLFQNRAPAEYMQRAIAKEVDLSFYESWLEEEPRAQPRRGLHQASFCAEALLHYLPFALAQTDTHIIHIITASPELGPHLEKIWAENKEQPKPQRDALISGIFSNEAAPEDLLAELFEERCEDKMALEYLAKKPGLPLRLQRALMENEPRGAPSWNVVRALAQNPGLAPELQREMRRWSGFEESIRMELLLNPSIDEESAAEIFEEANSSELQARCALHPRLPREKQRALIERGEEKVLAAISQRRDLTKDLFARITERAEESPGAKGEQIWRALASNESLPEELYQHLFARPICHEGLSRNRSTPVDILLLLAANQNLAYHVSSQKRLSRVLLREHGLSLDLNDDDIPF